MSVIDSSPFSISYIQYDDQNYSELLNAKVDNLISKFNDNLKGFLSTELIAEGLDIIPSPAKHFRQRCRFAIGHNGHALDSTTEPSSTSTNTPPKLSYIMWENGGPNVSVESFPIASLQIYNIMPIILHEIEKDFELYLDLRAINFLSSSTGDLIATLIYERPLDSNTWTEHATILRQQLLLHTTTLLQHQDGVPCFTNISLIGRSKGLKVVIGNDYIHESLSLADGRTLRYKQVDEGFSNPNSYVNAKVLDWLCNAAKFITTATQAGSNSCSGDSSGESSAEKVGALLNGGSDLLEMFCGNGNHTVALAGKQQLLC